MTVSIIMPVYNASGYLKEALDSVLQQTWKAWELIAIDDGSTDGSGAILDDYALRDHRIRVTHQSNRGVAESRQLGVSMATGDYCIHVDADDWVEPDYLRLLCEKAMQSDADLVWCDAYEDENQRWSMRAEESADRLIRDILCQRHWGTLWNRLIRREICQGAGIQFPRCSMWEDMAFVVQCLCRCRSIAYVNASLYHYRQLATSLTHTQSHRDISAEHRVAIDCISDFMRKEGCIDKYIYELRGLQLFGVRDFIDDKRFRDFDAFLNTYPDAIAHINEYPDYPWRLKCSAWLLQRGLAWLVPVVCRVDGVLRRLGLTKQI